MKKTNKMHRVAAAITAGMLVGETSTAHAAAAGTNLSNVADNVVNSTASLPNLIQTVAYIGGIGLGVAGIFKLKQHVDNPGQTPMKDGLIRLGAGGGLLALPYISQAMLGSVNGANAGQASVTMGGEFGAPAATGGG